MFPQGIFFSSSGQVNKLACPCVLVHILVDTPWYRFAHLLLVSDLTLYSRGSFQSLREAGLRAQEVLMSTPTPHCPRTWRKVTAEDPLNGKISALSPTRSLLSGFILSPLITVTSPPRGLCTAEVLADNSNSKLLLPPQEAESRLCVSTGMARALYTWGCSRCRWVSAGFVQHQGTRALKWLCVEGWQLLGLTEPQ